MLVEDEAGDGCCYIVIIGEVTLRAVDSTPMDVL